MNIPAIGSSAPDFSLQAEPGGDAITLSSQEGECVVVFFVPLAFSSTCTEEFCHLGENWTKWGSLGAKIYGISVDSPWVNAKWGEEMGIPFPILSDFNKEAMTAYGVMRNELAGLRGVANRSAFVVDPEGKIAYSWVSDDPGVLPPFDEIEAAVRAAG